MTKVFVVDYGIGNVRSVQRALEYVGGTVSLTDDRDVIRNADRLVVPGVGAFGDCMAELRRRELVEVLASFVESGRPYLGICVGMQMLFEVSTEFGEHAGLGVLPGIVQRMPESGLDGRPHKVPFVGWAPLERFEDAAVGPLFDALAEEAAFYFVHSFVARPRDSNHLLAQYDYDGHKLTAAVGRDNVVGYQFHPEKSGPAGLAVLKQFMAL